MHVPPKTSLHLEQNQLLYKSLCSNHFGEPSIFCWVKHPSILTNKPSHHASTLPTREPYGFVPPISDLPSTDLEQRNTNKIISAEKTKRRSFPWTYVCCSSWNNSICEKPHPVPTDHQPLINHEWRAWIHHWWISHAWSSGFSSITLKALKVN